MKTRDGGELRYRLDVQPDTWCEFALPEPEDHLPGGLIGASFDTSATPASIQQIAPGTPAEEAGLVAGDRILEVNGTPVTSGMGALAAIRASGDRVTLVLGRGGQRETVRVTKTPDTPPPLVEPARCGERPQPPPPPEREPYGLPYGDAGNEEDPRKPAPPPEAP